jgi:hypothetical protein
METGREVAISYTISKDVAVMDRLVNGISVSGSLARQEWESSEAIDTIRAA